MTAIDDFVEKYESRIDKIKSRPVRDAVRGFISAMDIFGFFFERIRKKEDWYRRLPMEFYSINGKSSAHYFQDVEGKHCKERARLIPNLAGVALGAYFSVMAANYAPWLAIGAVDLANLYLKKKEKKRKDL